MSKVICSSARACSYRDCSHRIIHELKHEDNYSCNKIPCETDGKPIVSFHIFCIEIKEIL